jgi:hypothetical protein
MSGKLPIDRVREAEDAPRIYEREKRELTRKEADLREAATPPPLVDAPEAREDEPDRGGDDA